MPDLPDPTALRPVRAGEPPTLDLYREGNAGIPYVLTFAAARPGPHVVLTAILHGNEPCGAIALDRMLRSRLRPKRGRLTFAFANVDAYRRREAGAPAPCRFLDDDMNRVWSPAVLDGRASSAELRRARMLRPVVDSADYLLDIHSMQQGAEPLLLSGPLEKGRRLALNLGFPSTVIADAGHAAGTRLRDYGAFGEAASPHNAVLVECGAHADPRSADIAFQTARAFLSHVGLIDPPAAWRAERACRGRVMIEVTEAVTAASARFQFTHRYAGLARVARAGTVIAHDGGRAITTPYDDCVLVMPADGCQPGQTAVRLGRVLP
jgi:predicted deacylase